MRPIRQLWTTWSLLRLRRFVVRGEGSVAGVAALVFVPVLLAAGLSVDLSRAYLVRNRLGHAADAAALAAAQQNDEALQRADAERVFRMNFPDNYMQAGAPDIAVAFDPETDQVTVTASTSVPTLLMRLAHIDIVDIGAEAVAQRQVNDLELALVLDVTGSMCSPCTKIDGLKNASRDLLDILFEDEEIVQGMSIAVVPFSARANIGTSRWSWLSSSAPSDWNGCVEARADPYAISDDPPSVAKWEPSPDSYLVPYWWWWRSVSFPCPSVEILPLSAERSVVEGVIEDLDTGGSTRIDIGARWGYRVLSPRWQGLWGHADSPRQADPALNKAIVIMTDGENTIATHDEVATKFEADEKLKDVCDGMKAEDFIIFTVGFRTLPSLRPLLDYCASEPGYSFESPDEETLRLAFRNIAGVLSNLRLVK